MACYAFCGQFQASKVHEALHISYQHEKKFMSAEYAEYMDLLDSYGNGKNHFLKEFSGIKHDKVHDSYEEFSQVEQVAKEYYEWVLVGERLFLAFKMVIKEGCRDFEEADERSMTAMMDCTRIWLITHTTYSRKDCRTCNEKVEQLKQEIVG